MPDGSCGTDRSRCTLPGGEAVPSAARTPTDAANRPPVGTPPAPPEWIRIATWNLNRLHWRTGGALWRGAVARSDEDYRILARYARALDADVIAFQEVNGPDAAARVFPSRDYELHISGRYDSRYADIYNGFAVRKGRFDQVVKRDYEALGLATGSRYQLRWGVDLLVSGDGRRLRLLNVHLKSKCFSKSLRNPRSRSCRTLARQSEPLEAWIDARWREGTPFVVLGDFNREMGRHRGRRPSGTRAPPVVCGPRPGLLARDLASPPLPNRSLRVRRTRMDAGGRIILPTSRLDRCGCGPAPRPALRSLSDRRGSLVTIASSHIDPHNLQTSRETVIQGRCGMISTVGPTIHRTALPVRQGPSTGAVKYSDHPRNTRRHQLNSDEH